VGSLLGSGGFGATYRAVDRARFGAACVVKELHPGRRSNETARRLFEREARLLCELSHPQIPKLHAFFEEEGRFYLMQDFVEGETLDDRLARVTRLGEGEVVSIVDSLLGVLEYLHGRSSPVIHRDIKPANIILGTDGLVHLIDFGAVREAVGGDRQHTSIGTPGYTPREQAIGSPRPSSDLYALGATALELLSGLPPLEWHDRATGQLSWKGRITCSHALELVLEGMLADLPQRFPTATSARQALQGAMDMGAAPSVAIAPAAPPDAGVVAVPAAAVGAPAPLPASASTVRAQPQESHGERRDATPARAAAATTPDVQGARGRGTHLMNSALLAAVGVLLVTVMVLQRRRDGGVDGTPAAPAAALVATPDSANAAARSQSSARRDSVIAPLPSGSGTSATPPAGVAPPVRAATDSLQIVGRDGRAVTVQVESLVTTPGGRTGRSGAGSRSDSVAGAPPRQGGRSPDSLARECARLLERMSLGERLTDAESSRLRRDCNREE